MAPKPTSRLFPPPNTREADHATERDSVELFEGLLDLTLNVFTARNEVDGREIRPAVSVRRLLTSLRHFPPPREGSMSDRLRSVVVAKRRELLAGIARQATVIAKRLSGDHSPGSTALHDLWQQAGRLLGSSGNLDLRSLAGGLSAALCGPLRSQVGYRDPLKFRDDIQALKVGTEAERTTVLKRWAAQIERTWSPSDPRVRRRLQEDDHPAALKREALYAGLWEAVTDSDRPQRVRLGKKWVKDHAQPISHPKPMRVRPARYLTRWMGLEQYWLWLRRRAIAGAEKHILGVPDDEFFDVTRREVRRFKDKIKTKTATPDTLPAALRRSVEDVGPLQTPASDEETDLGLGEDPRPARLERVLETANPDERALLDFWKHHPKGADAPSPEVARVLGKTRAAVRKLKERLLRRAREQL